MRAGIEKDGRYVDVEIPNSTNSDQVKEVAFEHAKRAKIIDENEKITDWKQRRPRPQELLKP